MAEEQANGTLHPPRTSRHHVKLIPQPTDDRQDPLNWPLSKKIVTLAIVSYAAFVCLSQALCNQSDFVVHGKVYDKTPTEMSYTISASVVGLAIGPILWLLLMPVIGAASCIFWGTLVALACAIWAGSMTDHSQYVPFTISRWLGSTFGSAATVAPAGTILDIFFLHQRGWAFAVFGIFMLFGVEVGGTTSGYIVNFVPWPVQFWWTAAADASVLLLVFFFLSPTEYPRNSVANAASPAVVVQKRSYVEERVAMFFPGNKVVTHQMQDLAAPFLVLISPVTLVAGVLELIAFGWLVGVQTLLAVFLQSPVEEGGYGYTPIQNANFTLVCWGADLVAEIYVFFLQDAVPIWLCQRRGGVWKPEYRLALLALPVVAECIGLGLFGWGFRTHQPIGVLAVAALLLYSSGASYVPILNNYLSESFIDHPVHAATALNFYRTIFGLTLPFFIDSWTARVGTGWVFGMMAFFTLFVGLLQLLLVFKGHEIRSMTFKHLQRSEEGEVLKET